MTTETLTGHELNNAVADALGVRRCRCWFCINTGPNGECEQCGRPCAPFYSAPDCSGLAPVLAWLEANRPTKAQVDAMFGVDSDDEGSLLTFERGTEDWSASYDPCFPYNGPHGGKVICLSHGESLALAACRLMVAWATRKASL